MSAIPVGPRGLVIAIQYWSGDADRAFRLARLLAAIESKPRNDVTVALCRRHDIPEPGAECMAALAVVGSRFPAMALRPKAHSIDVGHPDGCNSLAESTMEHFAHQRSIGQLQRAAVFLVEPDGCPLRRDWVDLILEEHEAANAAGLSVTGARTPNPWHLNGTMAIDLPWWADHPGVHYTPAGHAWDIFHRQTYLRAGRPTPRIANIHGAKGWTAEQLCPLSKTVAWLASTKDNSAVEWAERTLVAR